MISLSENEASYEALTLTFSPATSGIGAGFSVLFVSVLFVSTLFVSVLFVSVLFVSVPAPPLFTNLIP